MNIDSQNYYAKIVKIDEQEKFIESKILHFGVANENHWAAMPGSLDAFIDRINKNKKGVAACYQHDESLLIGVWKDFVITGNELTGKLYFVETPFVKDTVLPQLRAGILQGSSPSIAPIRDSWNQEKGIWEILEGALCEVSLVGIPADLRADIIQMRAKIESTQKQEQDFEIDIL